MSTFLLNVTVYDTNECVKPHLQELVDLSTGEKCFDDELRIKFRRQKI